MIYKALEYCRKINAHISKESLLYYLTWLAKMYFYYMYIKLYYKPHFIFYHIFMNTYSPEYLLFFVALYFVILVFYLQLILI